MKVSELYKTDFYCYLQPRVNLITRPDFKIGSGYQASLGYVTTQKIFKMAQFSAKKFCNLALKNVVSAPFR